MKTNLIPEPPFTPIRIELIIETPEEAAALIRLYDAVSHNDLRSMFENLFQHDPKHKDFINNSLPICMALIASINCDIEVSSSYTCVLEHLPRLPL